MAQILNMFHNQIKVYRAALFDSHLKEGWVFLRQTEGKKKQENEAFCCFFLQQLQRGDKKNLQKKRRKVIGPVLSKKWRCPISINVNTERPKSLRLCKCHQFYYSVVEYYQYTEGTYSRWLYGNLTEQVQWSMNNMWIYIIMKSIHNYLFPLIS